MRALRIPMLLDVARTGDPDEIFAVGADARLDRQYLGTGPVLNRAILRRLRRIVSLHGRPLPTVAPAADAERRKEQEQLEARLAKFDAPVDPHSLTALAEYVLGKRSDREIGPDAQQAIGSLFNPGYRANAKSWRAAVIVNSSIHGFASPLARLRELTGGLRRAKDVLAGLVDNDRAGVHATGVAIHNLVESLKRMKRLAREPQAFERYAPNAAASLSLAAPGTVLREAIGPGAIEGQAYRKGTIVLLELEQARRASLRSDVALMSCSWSRCPAHAWVPRLLAAVWAKAGSTETSAA